MASNYCAQTIACELSEFMQIGCSEVV